MSDESDHFRKKLLADGPGRLNPRQHIPEGTVLSLNAMRQLMERPPIIMHAGNFFGIRRTEYENAFTKYWLDKLGVKQGETRYFPHAHWEMLARAAVYRMHGHVVDISAPQPGSLDGIFSVDANMRIVEAVPETDLYHAEPQWRFGKTFAIMPNFTHQSRLMESPWRERLLRTIPEIAIHRMTANMEGGDTRVIVHKTHGDRIDNGFVMLGIADTNDIAMGRSTPQGHDEFIGIVQEYIDWFTSLVLRLKQPWYHLDTVGVPGVGGEIFTHPDIFHPKSWDDLQNVFGADYVVPIDYDDLEKGFVGNATNFGKFIYISDDISDRTVEIIRERGYHVVRIPLTHTRLAGGGDRCMTEALRVLMEGGFDFSYLDFGRTGQEFRVRIDYNEGRIFFAEVGSDGKLRNERDISEYAREFIDVPPLEQDACDNQLAPHEWALVSRRDSGIRLPGGR